MNTRRHPRTMAEAFGPYTSNTLHPMPDRKDRMPAHEIALYLVALIAVLVIVHFCN